MASGGSRLFWVANCLLAKYNKPAMALLVGVALAVAVGVLIAWIARRRNLSRPEPAVLVDGTCWFAQDGHLMGPCCEACQVQAMVRPPPPAAGHGALSAP